MKTFTKDSVVCFFGDSITANGRWLNRIFEYYRNVAKIPCEMYNCGVPGDWANGALNRYPSEVLPLCPTDIVVMFGMNDIGRGLYDPEREVTPALLQERETQIQNCLSGIRKMAEEFTARGIHLIFCTPTPYDELQDVPEKNLIGCSAALTGIGEELKKMAPEFGAEILEFNQPMLEMQKQMLESGHTLIGGDRVHPVPEGYELMALLFLQAQGFPVKAEADWDKLQELVARPWDELEAKREEIRAILDPCAFSLWILGYQKNEEELDVLLKKMLEERTAAGMTAETDYITRCVCYYPQYKAQISLLREEYNRLTREMKARMK